MASITPEDLQAGLADLQTIKELATSADPTVTDRLGNTKPTWSGLVGALEAEPAATQMQANRTAAEAAAASAAVAAATVGAYPQSAAAAVPAGVADGDGYWVQSADGLQLDRYQNVGGVATADPSIGPLPTVLGLQAAGGGGGGGIATAPIPIRIEMKGVAVVAGAGTQVMTRDGNFTSWFQALSAPLGPGDTVIEVKLNGATVATVTYLAGEQSASIEMPPDGIDVLAGDVITYDVISAGAGSADVSLVFDF